VLRDRTPPKPSRPLKTLERRGRHTQLLFLDSSLRARRPRLSTLRARRRGQRDQPGNGRIRTAQGSWAYELAESLLEQIQELGGLEGLAQEIVHALLVGRAGGCRPARLSRGWDWEGLSLSINTLGLGQSGGSISFSGQNTILYVDYCDVEGERADRPDRVRWYVSARLATESGVNAQVWGRDSVATGQVLSDGIGWTTGP